MNNIQFLGREGVFDDTKPIRNEESIYKKLKNNEKEILKDNQGFYKKLKRKIKKGEQQ